MTDFLRRVVDWFGDGSHWHDTPASLGIPSLLVGHLELVGASLAVALVVALPIGLWLGHTGRGGVVAVNVTNVGRALPSFALLVLAVQAIGIGRTAAVIAITLLSIPPVLTNTFTAVRGVADADRDAARGMGMTGWQVLTRVELPAAVPLIFAGIRTAAVQAVATATLAGLEAYNCLGTLIYTALDTGDHVELFCGAVLVVALGLIAEYGLGALQRLVTPTGLRLGDPRVRRRRLQAGAGDTVAVDASVGATT